MRQVEPMPAGDPAHSFERNSAEAEAAYASAPAGLRVELVHGVVCMAPAPSFRHQRVAQRVAHRVLARYDRTEGDGSGPGGWVIAPEPELHLGARPDKLRPDLAAWREERARFAPRDTAITVAPDWVCEVLSPSTETIDRGTKAPVYAEHGVQWLWLVDLEARVVEVFRNERGVFRPAQTLREGDGEHGALPPFEAASLVRLFED